MKYKDLREMNVKDWDGQPFRAVVADIEDNKLYASDVVWLNEGVAENGVLITGYNKGRWYDDDKISWLHAYPMEWNKKPKERRMTNRQVAMWLAKGNGELSGVNYSTIFSNWSYPKEGQDSEVSEVIKIRKWGSDEWIEPTVDLLEGC